MYIYGYSPSRLEIPFFFKSKNKRNLVGFNSDGKKTVLNLKI